jgi:outer membrane receptor protein involved in Fe transport
MRSKLFLLLVFIAAFYFSSNAQTKKVNISGVLKDSAQQKALSFVTISLYKQGQLALPIKNTYTDNSGKFQLADVDTGNYTIFFTHTGFTEKQQDVTVNGDGPVNLNEIILQASVVNLKDVTVTTRKPLIEQTDDKVVFNVENDPTTKTETAIDILRKTPFVSVDGDGNVQVNGQTNFKVLLNGRETAMFAQNVKEALKGFPGTLITKIEVITQPSAKYDAEGVGGIINIITRKKVVGYNGSISTYYSSTSFYNINANLSAKFGKIGGTINYGAGGATRQPGKTFTQTIPINPAVFTRRTLQGNRLNSFFWNFGNGEISYEVDSMNTLSAYANISGGKNSSIVDQTITTDYASAPSSNSLYKLDSRYLYPTLSVGTDFIRKFKSNTEKEFSIRLNGEFSNANSFLNSEQDNYTTDRFILNNSIAKNKQYTIQSDYLVPFKTNQKIEVGGKIILRNASSDFESLIKYQPESDYEISPSNTNNFRYNQDVYSAYTSYNLKIKKVTYRVGGRVEHTQVKGDFVSTNTAVRQSYTSFLPNLQATIKFNNTYTLVLGYNKRLQRPGIWNLNPFVNNNDSLNIFFGNPNLGPQTIHALSAQTRITKGTTFVGLTLMGSYSDNTIVQYATFDRRTGVTKTTSTNLGEEFQLSLNGNITAKFTPDWNFFVNGNVRYNKIKNKALVSQVNDGFGGNANMNSSYTFNKKFMISSYAGFWGSPATIQERMRVNIWYGLGFGYKFFKEKLVASLGLANFMAKEREWWRHLSDPNFTTETKSTFPYRGATINITWNFGKLTENVSKKKGVSNDDLISNSSSN